MKRASILALACALGACWESGTEAPPIAAIVSPLEDAGGRFRSDVEPPTAAVLNPPPTLVRSGRLDISQTLTNLDLEATTGKKLTPEGTLIVVTFGAQEATLVRLGAASLRLDGSSLSLTLKAGVWSRRIGMGDSQLVSVVWDGSRPRGLVLWMEWLGLGLSRGSSGLSGDGPILTDTFERLAKGSVLLAVAAARPGAGLPEPPFEYVGGAAFSDFGAAVGYVIADGTTAYRARFTADRRPTDFTTLVTPYPPLYP